MARPAAPPIPATTPSWQPFEAQLRARGYLYVAGVDEAGRGCLAGPVVAAALIFPPDLVLPGVADSKLLSEAQREALFEPICAHALSFGIGLASPSEIDAHNILQATFLAMQRAIACLSPPPDMLLVDGSRRIPCLNAQRPLVKGDRICHSIAAASILAKVSRDRLMVELAACYPQFGFQQHKGYPTELHRRALAAHGPSLIHRRTFRGVRELLPDPAPEPGSRLL